MNGVEAFLEEVRKQGTAEGKLRGLLHVLIGRRITRTDGTVVSAGMTWRTAAELMKRVRWPIESVRDLGIDPDKLPPRDRHRFWFGAIAAARIDEPEAVAAGDAVASAVLPLGYVIGPAPRSGSDAIR